MKRSLHFGVVWLLLAPPIFGAQKNPKPPKPEPPPRNAPNEHPGGPAAKNDNNFKNPEAPKGGLKGGGAPRLGTPGNPVERLMAMPPEQRERVLEKLPANQQANLRQRLDRFDKLPPNEKARLNQMWTTYNNLPAEKKEIVSRQMNAFNALPEERRQALAPVLQRLRRMPEEQRQVVLNREQFKNRFSASEWQMLSDISQNFPLPPPAPR
jgi:hypothetical protein